MALNDQPYVPDPGKFYMTDAFTDHAVRLIDEYGRKPEPHFLYLAYTAPHWPLHAWPEDIKGWDALRLERHRRQLEMGFVDRKWPLTPRDSTVPAWETVPGKEAQDPRMAVYAAQIDRLDQDIGKVLAKVKELGQEENTLVHFLGRQRRLPRREDPRRKLRPSRPRRVVHQSTDGPGPMPAIRASGCTSTGCARPIPRRTVGSPPHPPREKASSPRSRKRAGR